MSNKFRIVLKEQDALPNVGRGILILKDIDTQPYLDNSGNIEMSGNFITVKNMEAGVEHFTTQDEQGIINVYSDSLNTHVSCINFMHNISGGGYSRRYCSFQPNNTNHIAGSITGNGGQVSFNTTSDSRVKNILNNNGTYMLDPMNNNSYSNWLSSVNALKPCVYSYNSPVGDQMFTYTLEDGTTKNVMYQGFLANEVQSVYPPAVTGISGETEINTNDETVPIYQQLDMTKLIPMMVGAIQELSTKVTDLTNKLTTTNNTIRLSVLNSYMSNDWTYLSVSENMTVYYTILSDPTMAIKSYLMTLPKLASNNWGVNSLTSINMTPTEKQTLLETQISEILATSLDITDIQFVYQCNVTVGDQTTLDTYDYSYCTVTNNTYSQSSFSGNNPTGTIGLIYSNSSGV